MKTTPDSAWRLRDLAKSILLKEITFEQAIDEAINRGETRSSALEAFAFWSIKH